MQGYKGLAEDFIDLEFREGSSDEKASNDFVYFLYYFIKNYKNTEILFFLKGEGLRENILNQTVLKLKN